jgi:hypothetical protein
MSDTLLQIRLPQNAYAYMYLKTLNASKTIGYANSRPPRRDFSGDVYRKDAHIVSKLMEVWLIY